MTFKPILLITGANTGLGLETVKSLCQSSKAYTILLSGRNLEKAKTAVQEVQKLFPDSSSHLEAIQLDIEVDESINQAFEHVSSQYGRLDILVNNAGSQFESEFYGGKMGMRELWNRSWAVNTTGTQIVTHTFVPLLLKSSDPRLIFIASGTSTLAESEDQKLYVNKSPAKGWPKQTPSVPAYRSSKTGMNMMMREWNRILKEDGVKIWCVSPGFLATGLGPGAEMTKKMGAGDPVLGANFVRDVIEGAQDAETGKVVRRDGVQPW